MIGSIDVRIILHGWTAAHSTPFFTLELGGEPSFKPFSLGRCGGIVLSAALRIYAFRLCLERLGV